MEEKEQELRTAAARGDTGRVEQLLAEGVKPGAADGYRWTPLHRAASNGHPGTVKTLLTAGADINARSDRNWTPLHVAAKYGHPRCVEVLLRAGANTVIRDTQGETAEETTRQEDVLRVFQLFKGKRTTVVDQLRSLTLSSSSCHFSSGLQPKVVEGLLTISLKDKELTSVPAEVFDAADIECLDLSYNRLTSIPEEIGQLHKLRTLRLNNNLLTQLPHAVTTLRNLSRLEVDLNKIDTLPVGISNLRLRELHLDHNEFHELPEEVCSLLQLNTLSVTGNPLQRLPEKISRLTGLRRLFMGKCQFLEFPRVVLQLNGLEVLHMGNWAGESRPSPVPEDIGKMTSLRELSLQDSGLGSLPDGVGELSLMTFLDISGNSFTSVPAQIMDLPNLKELALSHNRISQLPLTLVRLAALMDLKITGNPLIYPPPDVCGKGTAAIMHFLRREMREKEEKGLKKMFFRFSKNVTERDEVKALIAVAGLTADDMTNILDTDTYEVSLQAHKVLLKWIETDREASLDKLEQELSDMGMDGLAGKVSGLKPEQLKRPADTPAGPPAKRPPAGGSLHESQQEEQRTGEKAKEAHLPGKHLHEEETTEKPEHPEQKDEQPAGRRTGPSEQLEQRLVQAQHQAGIQEAMVNSLRAEVTRLRDKDERAQKVLLEHKQEIQNLQQANVTMATQLETLLQDNEKLRSQVLLLGGEQTADEQTTLVLERTILMFTENVLQRVPDQTNSGRRGGDRTCDSSSELLTKLSCRLGPDWQKLGAALGIPQPRLDSIQQGPYSNDIQRTCKVLTVWMSGGEHGLPHDLKQLEAVLLDMDRADLAGIVRTAFKNYIMEMPEVVVEADGSVDEQGVTTWSVNLPGRGKYVCKQTDLGVVTPCPVQLTYRSVNPSEHWPDNQDWQLVGPLFHIQCNHDDGVPVELLLPHILDLALEDGSGEDVGLSSDDAKAAHVVAGTPTFHPTDVTPTHFITRHQSGSLWASVLQKLRALSVSRRGVFTLFKTAQTQDAVDIKAHIVSNTKDMVKTLEEDLSRRVPRFHHWDSIPCSFRPHQIYCLQAAVQNGILANAEPLPPGGLEYEDSFDRNRFYPFFHMTVRRDPSLERLQHPEHLQHLQLNLQLFPQAEDNNVVCSCTRYLYGRPAVHRGANDDMTRYFLFVKDNVGLKWRDLAYVLGFSRPDIDVITYRRDNRDAKDCCMDMLGEWQKREGDAATLQALLAALAEVGLRNVVDELNTSMM